MDDLGSRGDIIPAPAHVPFVRHIGERPVRVIERFDTEDPAQCVAAEFIFDTGSVTACSFAGDLHMAAADR
jgi:hypothetical protein